MLVINEPQNNGGLSSQVSSALVYGQLKSVVTFAALAKELVTQQASVEAPSQSFTR